MIAPVKFIGFMPAPGSLTGRIELWQVVLNGRSIRNPILRVDFEDAGYIAPPEEVSKIIDAGHRWNNTVCD